MDWKSIVKEMKDCGLTQNQIKAACGCSQSLISGIATGVKKNPSYATGQAMLALHKKAIRAARKESAVA